MISDDIREFVYERYIKTARESGQITITVRAGDVHKQMGLKNRLPAVCSAIGTQKFQDEYKVKLLKREGPSNGANMFFTFEV